MKPLLRLNEHGIVTPLRITPRYPLAGVFLSLAWLFDGETLVIRSLAKHSAGRTSRLIWEAT